MEVLRFHPIRDGTIGPSEGGSNAGILPEVSSEEGDQESIVRCLEEWPTSYQGHLPHLRNHHRTDNQGLTTELTIPQHKRGDRAFVHWGRPVMHQSDPAGQRLDCKEEQGILRPGSWIKNVLRSVGRCGKRQWYTSGVYDVVNGYGIRRFATLALHNTMDC